MAASGDPWIVMAPVPAYTNCMMDASNLEQLAQPEMSGSVTELPVKSSGVAMSAPVSSLPTTLTRTPWVLELGTLTLSAPLPDSRMLLKSNRFAGGPLATSWMVPPPWRLTEGIVFACPDTSQHGGWV